MAVAECATLAILPGETDGNAIGEDGGESEFFGGRPIDTAGVKVIEGGTAVADGLLEAGGIEVKTIECGVQAVVEGDELFGIDGCSDTTGCTCGGLFGLWVNEAFVVIFEGVVFFLHHIDVTLEDAFGLCGGDLPVLDEFLRPQFSDGFVAAYDIVHTGLGEAGFVEFVVTIATVADEVDEEIFFEFALVGEGDASNFDTGGGVIGIDVEDGDFEAFGEVTGVKGAASIVGKGREAELIVGDDMDRATCPIAG